VFGIQVGVSINLFVRLPGKTRGQRRAKICYYGVPVDWRRDRKYEFLNQTGSIAGLKWRTLKPDARNTWLTNRTDGEFAELMPLGRKGTKARAGSSQITVFQTYSLGVSTNRDSVVYGFDCDRLATRVEQFAEAYNAELSRWRRKAQPPKDPQGSMRYVDNFVSYDRVKWSETLKHHLVEQIEAVFDSANILRSLYRPFSPMYYYCASPFVDRPGRFGSIFPTPKSYEENLLLCVNQTAERPFACLATNLIPNLVATAGFGSATYCFPLYTYSGNGEERHENIPLPAVHLFQEQYRDKRISSVEVFRYVYGLLHHPKYRARYAENLKQEFPRIPLVGTTADFRVFAEAGRRLLDLHVNYEHQEAYPLQRVENPQFPLDWRVEAMTLDRERNTVHYNDFLTLDGIPRDALDYRLGNRSALEWVIDQYRVARDEQGNITSDPNRSDDEEYIVRLIGQIVTVSLETNNIVANLPPLPG
jgi:predicted helicase